MANEKRLIDANALFKRLQKRREDFADGWKTLDAMPINAQIQYHENLECALIAEDLPTVDAVEVVHGRWIDAREYCGDFMCSNCDALYGTNKFNYCPNCGARMDLEEPND